MNSPHSVIKWKTKTTTLSEQFHNPLENLGKRQNHTNA